MGIDWGGRRVGVALSDPSRTLARPFTILVREGDGGLPLQKGEKVLAALQKIASDHEVTGLVFGVPYYHLSGDPNPHAHFFLHAARELSRQLALPLFLYDEGQSSEAAREVLKERPRRRRSLQDLDHVAATAFLQGFLDAPPMERIEGSEGIRIGDDS
ncbi:MAG: Holliday junction resolvase RuvX [Leptospirillia bacterium]